MQPGDDIEMRAGGFPGNIKTKWRGVFPRLTRRSLLIILSFLVLFFALAFWKNGLTRTDKSDGRKSKGENKKNNKIISFFSLLAEELETFPRCSRSFLSR